MGLEHNVDFKGWNSQAQRGFPGKFDSSNVSRDNVSREIAHICLSRLFVATVLSVLFCTFQFIED